MNKKTAPHLEATQQAAELYLSIKGALDAFYGNYDMSPSGLLVPVNSVALQPKNMLNGKVFSQSMLNDFPPEPTPAYKKAEAKLPAVFIDDSRVDIVKRLQILEAIVSAMLLSQQSLSMEDGKFVLSKDTLADIESSLLVRLSVTLNQKTNNYTVTLE